MAYKIMIDAGHGGRDPGAVYNGRQEKDDVLALALAVGQILEDSGLMWNIPGQQISTNRRAKRRERQTMPARIFFVSIHRNSFPRPNEVSGVRLSFMIEAELRMKWQRMSIGSLKK